MTTLLTTASEKTDLSRITLKNFELKDSYCKAFEVEKQ